MMKHPAANTLVARKTFRTLLNSCYSDLCWAIQRLGVKSYWHCTKSPLEITYRPTGQKILFVGMDDPLKVTSISVPNGVLCWLWIEEAYEITSEDAFNRLDESIRGQLPEGLFTQVTLTFNPWSDRCWIKKRFFDEPDENVLAKTTNYLCNEFLSLADLALFEAMKRIRSATAWPASANGASWKGLYTTTGKRKSSISTVYGSSRASGPLSAWTSALPMTRRLFLRAGGSGREGAVRL